MFNANDGKQYNIKAFVPTYKEVQELSKVTGIDTSTLSEVVLGLQQVNIVFAQVLPPEQPQQPVQLNVEETKQNGTTATPTGPELADSLSVIADEFTGKK